MTFLLLIIMHLIGDFYLQSSKLAKCKNACFDDICNKCKTCENKSFLNLKYMIFHVLLYCIPFLSLVFMIKWTKALIVLAIMLVSHFVIDVASCYLNKKEKIKHSLLFLLDQGVHIALLFAIYKFFDFTINLEDYILPIKILLMSLIIIMPASIFINKLFEDLFPNDGKGSIFDIGSIIGVLERAIVLVFACFDQFATIAIIITVKTWARSADLKDKGTSNNNTDENKNGNFRDKYLLGTLTSLVIALLAFLIYKLEY